MNQPRNRKGGWKRDWSRTRRNTMRMVEAVLGPGFYVSALVLLAITTWAAYGNWARTGWGSDAAAWVQAAGSIAAIAGAAWLAQSDARRARRTRRTQGEEAAWFARYALVQAQREANTIAHELVNRDEPIDVLDVRGWRQRATTSVASLDVFAGRADHVHPAVVHVLANAKVLMNDLLEDIQLLDQAVRSRTEPSKDLIVSVVEPHHALIELIALFDSRMRGVRLALDEGGDVLPIRQWDEERGGKADEVVTELSPNS